MQLFLLLDHCNRDIMLSQTLVRSGKLPFCYPASSSASPVLESQVGLKADANFCVEVIIPSVYSGNVGWVIYTSKRVVGWKVDWFV